jgi:hypothetical protein
MINPSPQSLAFGFDGVTVADDATCHSCSWRIWNKTPHHELMSWRPTSSSALIGRNPLRRDDICMSSMLFRALLNPFEERIEALMTLSRFESPSNSTRTLIACSTTLHKVSSSSKGAETVPWSWRVIPPTYPARLPRGVRGVPIYRAFSMYLAHQALGLHLL